jgi:predicted Na+-dependent transporter
LKRFHFIFGLLMFVAFLLTGQYMDKFHNHLDGAEIGVRMLYRTRHIFILLASLLQLGLGLYLQTRAGQWQKRLQLAGSAVLTGGTLLLVYAFFSEPKTRDLTTPFSHQALYLLLLGIVLHGLSSFNQSVESKRQNNEL